MLSTQLNGDILKPQFLEQLKYLRERCTSEAEREKCDRLAVSLFLSSQAGQPCVSGEQRPKHKRPQRPHTAMAAPDCGPSWDPYESTTTREYTPKPGTLVLGLRPKSSKGYRYPYELSDPIGGTSYTDDFPWKPYSKPEPIRAATSSGTRNHNPNPNQGFMTWKLPRKENNTFVVSRSPWSKPPSLEEARNMIKAQYNSTYKQDYLGVPLGFQVKHAFSGPSDWKEDIPRPLNTEFRHQYQIPPYIANLANMDLKYGSYANLHCAIQGIVPTVSYAHIKNQENKIQRTTYQRSYGRDYVELPISLDSLHPEEVKRYLECVPKEERIVLERFLKMATKKEDRPKSAAWRPQTCDLHRTSKSPACPP
ncbi:testis-expressed protein 26 isoform X1 [Ambystoma mexicanum]|uniref:testis-expressed protein 26 isoform X1 n=1 Tax=Ambystoma mexicanum TaxID=8296 RepID=UPI0037E76C34